MIKYKVVHFDFINIAKNQHSVCFDNLTGALLYAVQDLGPRISKRVCGVSFVPALPHLLSNAKKYKNKKHHLPLNTGLRFKSFNMLFMVKSNYEFNIYYIYFTLVRIKMRSRSHKIVK